jgi:hypothetical protein
MLSVSFVIPERYLVAFGYLLATGWPPWFRKAIGYLEDTGLPSDFSRLSDIDGCWSASGGNVFQLSQPD